MTGINRKGKATCGESAGRALVDGIEPESASMLGRVDLGLSSFINSELTWKNRRSRNSLDLRLNVGAELGTRNCKRDPDLSESEEIGVAVLGQHFDEKIVNVPIKKRRFSIRPPSPPPRTLSPDHKGSLLPPLQTPQQAIESEQIVDIKPFGAGIQLSPGFHYNSKKGVTDNFVALKFEGKVDEVPNDKKYEMLKEGYASYDFSGIELLAATACCSSIDNDVKLEETCALKAFAKVEAVDYPNATIPFIESIASSITSHVSGNELVNEDDRTTIAAVSKNENNGVVRNRAHWDLNTLMEEWEDPGDVTPIDCQINYSEMVTGGTHCEKINTGQSNINVLVNTDRDQKSILFKEALSDVGCFKEVADGIGVAVGRSCMDEDALKLCPSPDGTDMEKQYCSTTERVKEVSNVPVHDTIAYLPLTSIEASANYLCPEVQHTASLHVFEEKMYASKRELEQVGGISCGFKVEENEKLSSECLEVGKLNISAPNLPLLNISPLEIDETQIKDCNYIANTTGSPNCKTPKREVISTATFKVSDAGNPMVEIYRTNHSHLSPKSEALSASSTSVAVGEVKLLSNKVSAADSNVIDDAVKYGPVGLFVKSDCPSKFDQDNNMSDCYDKDSKKAYNNYVSEFETGYDSSFEDGELREPGVYTWEDDDLEGEIEYVDYGSEYGDKDYLDTVNSNSANVENGHDGYQSYRKGTLSLNNNGITKVGDNTVAVAGDSKPLKQCFGGNFRDDRHLAFTEAKTFGGNWYNKHFAEGKVNGYDDKSLYAGESGTRTFRGNQLSFSKGTSPFDSVEKKSYLGVHRNRFDNSNYSNSKAERGSCLEKSRGRGRFSYKPSAGRNETDGQWVDCPTSYRGTRNRYHGPEGHAYSRPRDLTACFATKNGEPKYEDDRRSIIYSSNFGRRQSSMGRRSPANREDSYVVQREIPPVRGIDQDKSRGRWGQYTQGIRRIPKPEYSEDIPPNDAARRRIHREPYFGREKGFSPYYGSGNFMHRNSCSQSPTRSPVAWSSQRDCNMNTRRRNPDFRSDSRSEKTGFPFRNTYGVDNKEIYMSPPKSRVSPHSNSRWFNDRNYTDNHFRDKRSPFREFRGGRQRMEYKGYFGKRSDGIFQANIHRGRFQQVSSRREPELEVNIDEKSNHDDRYEIKHQVRHCDTGGTAGKFRYNANDCNANDDNVGHAIKRDIPRNGAGEERGLRFKSGDDMGAGALFAGQLDFSEDAATREE
ncbi:hypothetical protein ACET3Z_009559 [Daucus carota]